MERHTDSLKEHLSAEQTIYYMQESSKASDNWFRLLKEVEDPTYIHRTYEVEIDVRISKTKGGNKDQTLDDIRSIERVMYDRIQTTALQENFLLLSLSLATTGRSPAGGSR